MLLLSKVTRAKYGVFAWCSRGLAPPSLAPRAFFRASDFRLLCRQYRFIDRFNALLCIVFDAINRAADGVRLRQICIVGTQHCLQSVEIRVGAKPPIRESSIINATHVSLELQHVINSILSFDNRAIWIARIHFAASKDGEIGGSRMDTDQPA